MCNAGASNAGSVPLRSDIVETELSPANMLIPLERQLIALQPAADSFYIMKLCIRLFVLYCRSRPKDDKSRHLDRHFEEVRGGVVPWWMARWKARGEFLLSVIELLFYLLRLRRYKAKCVKTRCLQEGGRSLSGGKGRPPANILTPLERQVTALQFYR